MKRKLISIAAAAALAVSVFSVPVCAEEVVKEAAVPEKETCRTLTDEWFGDGTGSNILNTDTVKKWTPVLSAYETERETPFLGGGVQNKQAVFASIVKPVILDSGAVSMDEQKRRECILAMERRLHMKITDAETTVQIKNVSEENGRVVLDVYEWTFFDYLDLAGDGKTTDVSGYGVDHRLILEKTNAGYEIVSDTYDEGELTGMASSDYEKTQTEAPLQGNCQASYGAPAFKYNPDKAAAYADKYVKQGISGSVDSSCYNPAYKNFNDAGGDCTNYVSQCIYAGGLPMDPANGWFYTDESYYGGEWCTARRNYPYMSGIGKAVTNPSDQDIKKGSPVYYSTSDHIQHTTICVGTNSAGTPIIDSHNKDYYHVRWNYWGDGAAYYTVQLPSSGGTAEPPEDTTTVEPGSAGDTDQDGKLTSLDALNVLQSVVGLRNVDEEMIPSYDVNDDKTVTSMDALLILERVVGLLKAFPK